jgi:hypothetical protein
VVAWYGGQAGINSSDEVQQAAGTCVLSRARRKEEKGREIGVGWAKWNGPHEGK